MTDLPVRPQGTPFDADVGPDSAGVSSFVVSLCDGSCDLYVRERGARSRFRRIGSRAFRRALRGRRIAQSWTSFAGGRLAFLRACQGDPGGCSAATSGAIRYRIADGSYELAGANEAWSAWAVDGHRGPARPGHVRLRRR